MFKKTKHEENACIINNARLGVCSTARFQVEGRAPNVVCGVINGGKLRRVNGRHRRSLNAQMAAAKMELNSIVGGRCGVAPTHATPNRACAKEQAEEMQQQIRA